MSPSPEAFLGVRGRGFRQSFQIQVKLSVEGRAVFLSAPFLLALRARTAQHSQHCGHLKKLSGENGKKVKTKLEGE